MTPRLLTKSRFKQAMECPNKLFYTRKKEYANRKLEDSFLEALAQGGFQVEELARMEYPEGILIEGNDGDYELLAAQTAELLQRENVVIFEAAFRHEQLFIRTDILVKRGERVQLIEVKAKSFDPEDEYLLKGKKGGLASSWKPYLFDVAFQRHVIRQCHPQWKIQAFLMLADKSREAQVEGLNQMFRITRTAGNRTGISKTVSSLSELGSSVMGKIGVDELLNEIEAGKHACYANMSFHESIREFSKAYAEDRFFNSPASYSGCKSCEYRATEAEEAQGLRSGFKECWTRHYGWSAADFTLPNTFEVWSFRKGEALLQKEQKIFLKDLSPEDIGYKPEAGKLSTTERQWLQIEKAVSGDAEAFVLKEELQAEMASFAYPLNFIDFETSATALPFNKGRRPYEQVAFQFSHHTVDAAGKVCHESEYIHFEPGQFPNFEFVRALKQALEKNWGSIFRYSNHENSILCAIHQQLAESQEPDREALQAFIRSITTSTGNSTRKWQGERNMIDLCRLVKDYYYHPLTRGSNSIKAVLPAMLATSPYLQQKYSKPLAEISLSSRNFGQEHRWLQFDPSGDGEQTVSPYKLLPPLFSDWSEEQLASTVSDLDAIADGGAALTAYGKLQYTNMSPEERHAIRDSLLKYCELDTLAMVMIWEGFVEVVGKLVLSIKY